MKGTLIASALIAVLAAALIAVSVPIATVVLATAAAAAVALSSGMAHLALHETDELWGCHVSRQTAPWRHEAWH
jgi:hypothetical protein